LAVQQIVATVVPVAMAPLAEWAVTPNGVLTVEQAVAAVAMEGRAAAEKPIIQVLAEQVPQ
jgi:hypothetical protein